MSGNRNLQLSNIEGIRIDDVVITPATLEADAKNWHGYTFMPGIGKRNFSLSDEKLLRMLCFDEMPFTLIGGLSVVLLAEVVRFPYSINGELAFQAFACRLRPKEGRIAQLVMNRDHGLAINALAITPEGVMMDVGNGSTYLEVYFEPRNLSNLAPLRPPKGYQETVLTDSQDGRCRLVQGKYHVTYPVAD